MNYAQMLVNLHTLLLAGHEFSANTLLGKRMITYRDEPGSIMRLFSYAWQFHYSRGWSKNVADLLDHLISHCGATEVSIQIIAQCQQKNIEII